MQHLRYDTTNGESVVEIVLELINSTSIPPTFYHPASSVMYHKPFGAVAIFCACLFVACLLCFGPCVIIRGCFAKVMAAFELFL